jgi:hypothetical protein
VTEEYRDDLDDQEDDDDESSFSMTDEEVDKLDAEILEKTNHRLSVDRVYVVLRLLASTAWIRKLEKVDAPESLLDINRGIRARVVGYADEWALEQYERHWPAFLEDWEDQNNKYTLEVIAQWEEKLYRMYYPSVDEVSN